MTRTLFELAYAESPFVWRTKFALGHKGLDYTSRRVAFTDIPTVLAAVSKTVPVLREGDGTNVQGSWGIAEHLDETYPDAPTLLAGTRAREVDELISTHAFPSFFPLYVHDIWASLPEEQALYFRKSREARLGAKLEEISADREGRLPGARKSIQPLRDAFDGKPWLNGDAPAYADHIALAFFVWIASVAQVPPLASDDLLLDWIERGFGLYGGIAEHLPGEALSK
ncbi:MAG: glutathione S-transferase N-terminal domain-containing protein [Myxococcota bacterium]